MTLHELTSNDLGTLECQCSLQLIISRKRDLGVWTAPPSLYRAARCWGWALAESLAGSVCVAWCGDARRRGLLERGLPLAG